MMNQNNDTLNEIFHALADSTRREMIRLLAEHERTVSEIAEPFDISLAAVSKHLKVLEKAGLVERNVKGRTHHCRLNAKTLSPASNWLNFYERVWDKQFDALERELYKAEKKEH